MYFNLGERLAEPSKRSVYRGGSDSNDCNCALCIFGDDDRRASDASGKTR
jgi:hypothetical protein